MKKQKGQILLVTLFVFLAIFALGIGLGSFVLFEIRSMINLGESIKALYAAESGVEWRLYCRLKASCPPPPSLSNETQFRYEESEDYIRVAGETQKTTRALEITFYEK